MAGLIDTREDQLNDNIWGSQAWSPPGTWYLGLFTVLPADDGTGGTEAAYTAYARLTKTNNLANFPASAAGTKSTSTVFDFGVAGSGPTTIVGVGFFDAVVAGNLWAFASLTAPVVVSNGQDVFFSAGNLTFTVD